MGVSAMNLREEIIKNLDTLSDDALEGVLEYIQFIQEPEEVEPTERASSRPCPREGRGVRQRRIRQMAGYQD